jgi:hypothetical protein
MQRVQRQNIDIFIFVGFAVFINMVKIHQVMKYRGLLYIFILVFSASCLRGGIENLKFEGDLTSPV